jgi:hypothetical protein
VDQIPSTLLDAYRNVQLRDEASRDEESHKRAERFREVQKRVHRRKVAVLSKSSPQLSHLDPLRKYSTYEIALVSATCRAQRLNPVRGRTLA